MLEAQWSVIWSDLGFTALSPSAFLGNEDTEVGPERLKETFLKKKN